MDWAADSFSHGRSGCATEASNFVALELAPVVETKWAATRRAIEVKLERGRSLVVEPGFPAHHLRALLWVLEREHDRPASSTTPVVVLKASSCSSSVRDLT